MHVEETRHVRRFVVRIEPGEDLVASLDKLAKTEVHRAGWIRARGVVAWALVASWDDGRRAWREARHLEGPLTLVAEGMITTKIGEPTIELDATLSAASASTGGRLVAAAALSIDVWLEVVEDVRLERQDDDALGMAVWRGHRIPGVVARPRAPRTSGSQTSASPPAPPPAPAPSPAFSPPDPEPTPAVPSGPLSWAAVAQASAESAAAPPRPAPAPARPANVAPSFLEKRPTSTADEAFPQRGDWVEHRQFGLCKVEGEDPDGGTRVRLPTGARKVLRLDVMEILPPRHEADRTVFPVRPRTR